MANQTDSIFQSDMEIKRSIPGQWQSISSLISPQIPAVDFGEIKGQYLAKRVLEIAAAGSHHTMLIGPTGSGKTMFIKAFPSILPEKIIKTTEPRRHLQCGKKHEGTRRNKKKKRS